MNYFEEYGIEKHTTFWEDFTIADTFGLDAIQDTFDRAFKEWKNNYVYLTELVLVLNWKIWQHYENYAKIAKLYDKLWKQADEYACNNLKGKEAEYFYRITD